MSQFDVAVVGAGMVGATTALALQKAGFSVALIDQHVPKSYDAEQLDLRVSAINLATWHIFNHLGAAETMAQQRISPFREMFVWNQQGKVHYDSAYAGLPCLGYIIENTLIQEAVLKEFQQNSSAQFFCPETIKDISLQNNMASIQLEKREIVAQLLVAADGANSQIRKMFGIQVKQWDYAQHAVVANIKTELHHQHTAWQRFLPTGPLAFLPMHEHYCTIVWSTRPQHAKALIEMDDTQFCQQLSEAFEYKLGQVEWTSSRASFPLRGQLTQTYVQDNLALVGDAAHTIHPLAGQGANIGFMDGACLAQTLEEARKKGRYIGDYASLRPYERWRSGDNWLMLNAMSGFKHLFSNNNPALHFLRNLGLNLTNQLPPLKQLIMQQASGTRGHLPTIAQNPYSTELN